MLDDVIYSLLCTWLIQYLVNLTQHRKTKAKWTAWKSKCGKICLDRPTWPMTILVLEMCTWSRRLSRPYLGETTRDCMRDFMNEWATIGELLKEASAHVFIKYKGRAGGMIISPPPPCILCLDWYKQPGSSVAHLRGQQNDKWPTFH